MPIRLNTTPEELAHFNRLNKYAKQVEKIYLEAVKEFERMAGTIKLDPNKPFSFKDFPAANARAKKLLQQLATKSGFAIDDSIRKEWNAANVLNDKLVGDIFHKTKLSGERLMRFKNRNVEALNVFQNRKVNGLGLSDRVWKNTQQFGKEIERALDIGLGEGKSAAALGREMRKYLNDPDMIWGKLRQKHGVAEAQKIWDDYKPGQGRYKSSIKNTERLTRTETNMAYRASDHVRWQQMDFIVGFEVRRSNNPFGCPVCESLAGKYPKDYVWNGNHPQCRCYKVPIMMTDEELDKMEDAILNDRPINFKSKNEITDIPGDAKKWWRENQHRMSPKSAIPYFLKDNQRYYKGLTEAKSGKTSHLNSYPTTQITNAKPTKTLDLSTVQEVMGAYAKRNKVDFARGYAGIKNAPTGSKYYMSTDTKGSIFINFAENNGFDAGTSLVNAVSKISKGKALNQHEEYSLEVLWHEVLHNKTKNTTLLPDINDIHGFSRTVLETTHQLFARKTYTGFTKKLGYEAKHSDWVLNSGFGYSETVANMRKLLSTLKIDEDIFVKQSEKFLMDDYANFDEKIRGLIAKLSKRKDSWKVIDVFNRIERDNFEEILKILD